MPEMVSAGTCNILQFIKLTAFNAFRYIKVDLVHICTNQFCCTDGGIYESLEPSGFFINWMPKASSM